MADVCWLHEPEQGMPEGFFPSSSNQSGLRPHTGCELLSFLEAYLGYHQIPHTEMD
jgi:hypothetical protein